MEIDLLFPDMAEKYTMRVLFSWDEEVLLHVGYRRFESISMEEAVIIARDTYWLRFKEYCQETGFGIAKVDIKRTGTRDPWTSCEPELNSSFRKSSSDSLDLRPGELLLPYFTSHLSEEPPF